MSFLICSGNSIVDLMACNGIARKGEKIEFVFESGQKMHWSCQDEVMCQKVMFEIGKLLEPVDIKALVEANT